MELNLSEKYKTKPLGKMVLKALDKDLKAEKETDKEKKRKLEDQARIIQMNATESLEYLCDDPLASLYDLVEAELNVVPKPQLNTDFSAAYMGPNQGDTEHPVARKRAALDAEMQQGSTPIEAHQQVHGDVDLGDTTSKRMLAGTLGRIQNEKVKTGITLQPELGSLLSKDAELEIKMNQVTHDDLRTPMRGQVPDHLQTPADQVAEEVCYDYMEDVSYLQKYGRA